MDYFANKIPNMVTPYEWTVLATSLDDIGDPAQAEKYFKKAFLSYAVNGGQDRYRMRRRMSRLIGLTVGL